MRCFFRHVADGGRTEERRRNLGDILMGFAALMMGMQTMSAAVSPLKARHIGRLSRGECSLSQGTEAQIDRVIRMIERGLYVRVERMEQKTIPIEPDERGFETRSGYRW